MLKSKKMIVEAVKEMMNKLDCSAEDAFTHPDVAEDMIRLVYTMDGHDFDDLNDKFEIDDCECAERMEKIQNELIELINNGE